MRNSRAMTSLNAIKANLGQRREPLCLVTAGADEDEVARKLDLVEPVLENATSNQVLTGFDSPATLWPHGDFQRVNRETARQILGQRDAMRQAVLSNGFGDSSMGLAEGVFQTWQRAVATTN